MTAHLQDLLEELREHRSPQTEECRTQFATSFGMFQRAWPGMLLAHRFNGVLANPKDDIRRGILTLKAPDGSKQERARIGTDQCVFCSVGAAPYWDPPLVLLFGPLDAFTEHRTVAPWDTRGAVTTGNHLGLDGAPLIARYSLSHPDDASYLPELLATCFAGLEPFIAGARPLRVDPAGVWHDLVYKRPSPDRSWLHTPEARFNADIELGPGGLRAVLVDLDAFEAGQDKTTLQAISRIVEKAGGKVVQLRRTAGAVNFQAAAAAHLVEWLHTEGWIP